MTVPHTAAEFGDAGLAEAATPEQLAGPESAARLAWTA